MEIGLNCFFISHATLNMREIEISIVDWQYNVDKMQMIKREDINEIVSKELIRQKKFKNKS